MASEQNTFTSIFLVRLDYYYWKSFKIHPWNRHYKIPLFVFSLPFLTCTFTLLASGVRLKALFESHDRYSSFLSGNHTLNVCDMERRRELVDYHEGTISITTLRLGYALFFISFLRTFIVTWASDRGVSTAYCCSSARIITIGCISLYEAPRLLVISAFWSSL